MNKKIQIKNTEDRDVLLRLNTQPEIGQKTLSKIIHYFHRDIKQVFDVKKSELDLKFGDKIADLILKAKKSKFEIRDFSGVETVFYGDEEYPKLLSEIFDPPIILYCRGDLSLLNSKSISVVGSRKHTFYSKLVLEKIIPPLISENFSIVSGLALGVDGLAHFLTLENAGKTIAILGSGVDMVYPVANQKLADRILLDGGLLVSEFTPGSPPLKQNFPLRNRIIAGISTGTLVVEARYESGSLITANFANEYGREVFAVPGNIDTFASEGTNDLIKQGAKLVTSADDILHELGILSQSEVGSEIIADNETEWQILLALQSESLPVDKISKRTNLDIVTLNSAISILEISGKIRKVESGFRLNGKLKQKQGE